MPVLRQPVQEQERGRATPKFAPRPTTQLVVLGTDGLRAGVSRQPYQAGRGRHVRLLRGRIPANRAEPWGYFGPGLGGADPPPPGHAQVPRVQLEQKVLPRRSLSAASQAQPRRHEREVDQHARKRLHAGGGPAAADEMRAATVWRGKRLLDMESGVFVKTIWGAAGGDLSRRRAGAHGFGVGALRKKCDFRLGHLRAAKGSRTAVGPSRGGRCWACAATAQAKVGGLWDGRSNREGGSCRTGILEDWG